MKPAFPPIALLALLAACEMKIGKDKEEAGAKSEAPAASAAGKAEEGAISIDAPGFDMKLSIPDALRTQVGTDGDVIYPGSKLSGLHVQANEGEAQDSVELRFTTGDAPAKVAAWYRDPNQAKELKVSSAQAEGQRWRIAGTTKDGGAPFTLTLTPAAGGGTEGRVVLRDQDGR